ncbi:MAG: bifunctional lysine-specific demethylase and histidyl-hydroxylase [Actinomycetota bacterium]|nr:bifunctional lysine-specific demethylase and histidyl-hydroxylase [Actinomycetota bacterium]
MTSATDARVPGHATGHPALRRLVADPNAFARDVWGNAALLTPADGSTFADFFAEAAVDELVSQRGLRTPFIRVAQDGSTLATRDFTSAGGVGAGFAVQVDDSRLTALFADGATIVLQALHRTWPPLIEFTQQLAAELGHAVQVNAYVTPPQSRGFDDHYDVHDVFVVQISGEKHWRIHEPVHPAPLRDQPWTDRREAVAEAAGTPPVIDEVLKPGDCLYLPRGYLHAATARGGVSTHLTFGVHTWTRHALARTMLDHALLDLSGDIDIRTSLPLGVRVADPAEVAPDVELVRARLLHAIESLSADDVAAVLAAKSTASGRPEPIGPLAQLQAARSLTDDTVLVLRRHLEPRLATHDDGVRLTTRAGVLDLDAAAAPLVKLLLTGDPVRADALGLDLARRLLRAGVVVST